jgi:hypothetical protein
LGAAFAAALVAVACDINDTQHYQNTFGPKIRILSTNIDPATNEIPSDGAIQISFDRYLLPDTTTRQGYAIGDNTNKALPPDGLQTIYDPVARTITITGAKGVGTPWLTQGLDYKLVFFVPPDNTTDQNGFRAIDRSPLDSTQKLTYVFRAGAPTGVTSLDPPVDFCGDILPIFTAKCSDPTCHGTPTDPADPRARESMILATAEGVAATARGRVAQQSNMGPKSFTPAPDGPVFGIDMAIINPGNPGSSWLMYKLEKAPLPVIQDAGGASLPIGCTLPNSKTVVAAASPYVPLTPVQSATDSERERLDNLVMGHYMPFPGTGDDRPLTFDEREKVRIWIAHNAEVHECGCGPYTPLGSGDAGAP